MLCKLGIQHELMPMYNLHYNTHNMEPKLICLLVYHGYHRNVSKDVQFSQFPAGNYNSIIS